MQANAFGTSCYATGGDFEDTRKVLAYFQFLPVWIVVFHTTLVIYVHDFFFLTSNAMTQFVVYYYLLGLSLAIRSERPASYDYALCKATQYAFPDPLFVATLCYCFTIGYGLFSRAATAALVANIYRVLFFAFPTLYVVGLVVNDYFFWWQVLANIALAGVISLLYVFLYWKIMSGFNFFPHLRRWAAEVTGLDNVVLARHPFYANPLVAPQKRGVTANV